VTTQTTSETIAETVIAPESATHAAAIVAPESTSSGPSLFRRLLPGVVAAVSLLGLSAFVRYRMEMSVVDKIEATRFSPFPLSEIPLEIGPWKGKEDKLDEYIARKTGSTDNIARRYVNEQTGAVLEVLMLYGPAAEMGYHSPMACYPMAGFEVVGGGDVRPIDFELGGQKRTVGFRHLVFQRGEGGLAERQQVYYVWKYSDTYAMDLGQPSVFGRLPGMFKIQIGRGLARTESPDGRANAGNPCEDFLSRLMPIFEEKVENGSPVQNPTASATDLTRNERTSS
jgi:hypothetical protein